MKNHYKTLGIDKTADEETIRDSYKKLARKYHPDRNKSSGAAEKMAEINVAYKVLYNPEKRKEYDILQALFHKYRFEIPEEEFTRSYEFTAIKGKVDKRYGYILKLKKAVLWFLKQWYEGSIYVFMGIVYPPYYVYKVLKAIFVFSKKILIRIA